MITKTVQIVFVITLTEVLISCALISKFNILSSHDEYNMGVQAAREVERTNKLISDPALQEYINQIGQRVAQFSDRKNIQYRFRVIDNPKVVNAFALPGGFAYCYSALLLKAENEAEVAGVLAHETGHVVGKHAATRISKIYGLQFIIALATGGNPTMAADLVSNLFTNFSILKFSRDDEYEADRYGVKYLVKAGYDPQAMVSFFQKLESVEQKEPDRLQQLLSTHPPTSERIKRVQEEIQKYGSPSGIQNRDVYQQKILSLK